MILTSQVIANFLIDLTRLMLIFTFSTLMQSISYKSNILNLVNFTCGGLISNIQEIILNDNNKYRVCLVIWLILSIFVSLFATLSNKIWTVSSYPDQYSTITLKLSDYYMTTVPANLKTNISTNDYYICNLINSENIFDLEDYKDVQLISTQSTNVGNSSWSLIRSWDFVNDDVPWISNITKVSNSSAIVLYNMTNNINGLAPLEMLASPYFSVQMNYNDSFWSEGVYTSFSTNSVMQVPSGGARSLGTSGTDNI
jgi:hypothetical protein